MEIFGAFGSRQGSLWDRWVRSVAPLEDRGLACLQAHTTPVLEGTRLLQAHTRPPVSGGWESIP